MGVSVIFAKNRCFRSPVKPNRPLRLIKCTDHVARVATQIYYQPEADWSTRCYGNRVEMADFWPKIDEK